MVLTSRQRLGYETLDSRPVHCVAQHAQPGPAGVRELVGITGLLRPYSPKEQSLHRVETMNPIRPVAFNLRHPQRAVAQRVGTSQADLTGRVRPDEPRQRRLGLRPEVRCSLTTG